MELKESLFDLAQRMRVGEINLDCLLICNDVIVEIETDEADAGYSLTAEVGRAPRDGRDEVFVELLAAILLGGTGRACLAIDGDRDRIVLCQHIDRKEIDIQGLEEELQFFLEKLAVWRARHARGELGRPEVASPNRRGTAAAAIAPRRRQTTRCAYPPECA